MYVTKLDKTFYTQMSTLTRRHHFTFVNWGMVTSVIDIYSLQLFECTNGCCLTVVKVTHTVSFRLTVPVVLAHLSGIVPGY